jgi:di/tricarboxylate transporter
MRRVLFGVLSLGLAALAAWGTAGCPIETRVAAWAITFLICCWCFQLVDNGTAALFFFLVLAVGRVTKPEYIFNGFATPAFWLVFSGLVIGRAISVSGLSRRLARRFRAGATTTYPALLARIIGANLVFAFLVPSAMGRIVIMLPLLADLARDCGFDPNDKGYAGILLAGIAGTYLPAFTILPANLPNIILAGSAKTIFNIDLGYMWYLLLHFPVLGLGKAVVLWLLLKTALPDTITRQRADEKPKRLDARERGTVVVLALALGCWMLDSLHGVSPGWVSLAAALVFLTPAPGWFGKELLDDIKIDTLLFVACAIGVGNVIRHTGLGDFATEALLSHLPLSPDGGAGNLATVLGLFMASGLMTSVPGIPSVFVPLAGHIADAAHLPLQTLLMLMVPAYSTVLLPYQAPPLVVGTSAAGLAYRHALLVCTGLSALTILVLFPLDLAWWKLLGVAMSR